MSTDPLRALPILTFVLTLAVCAAVVQAAVTPELPILTPKLRHLTEHPEHTVIVVGTSRVYRSFVPELFDAEVARRTGMEVRSFNFGVPALNLAELDLLVRELPRPGPGERRWVIVEAELHGWRSKEPGLTRRAIAWHTPEETFLACRWLPDGSPEERVTELWRHVEALGLRLLWSGVLATDLRHAWSRGSPAAAPEDQDADYVVADEGYWSGAGLPSASSPGVPPMATHSVAEPTGVALPSEIAVATYRDRMYGRIVARLRAEGFIPVLLRAPVRRRPPLPECDGCADVPVIDLGGMEANARLFEPQNQAEDEHLSDAGARLATGIAAEQFAAGVASAVH